MGSGQGEQRSGAARAQEALRDGRRLLALQRFAGPRTYLSAASSLNKFSPEQRKEPAAFETEWARAGTELSENSRASAAGALRDPAAVRALGEAAVLEARIYYETSLEYGRNTMPHYGFFYLGIAQAQREFAAFCRTLSVPSAGRAPQLRPLRAELDLLESDLLAAYRPPASIDKQSEFIAASSTLKEARELDEAGLRFGAMLRYLQVAQRLVPLRASPSSLDAEALPKRLKEWDARLSSGGVDHSLGPALSRGRPGRCGKQRGGYSDQPPAERAKVARAAHVRESANLHGRRRKWRSRLWVTGALRFDIAAGAGV